MSSFIGFQTVIQELLESVTSIPGVYRCYKSVLKIYIIQLVIEPQILATSSHLWKFSLKSNQSQNFGLAWLLSIHFSFKKQSKCCCLLQQHIFCDTAFSTSTSMMTKYRSQLVVQSELHISLSKISLRIDNLCKARQMNVIAQCKHWM